MERRRDALIVILLMCLLTLPFPVSAVPRSLDEIAIAYVKLVLALGELDSMYVDAYYGPAKWREEARIQKTSLKQIEQKARTLVLQLKERPVPAEESLQLRQQYLMLQLQSLVSRTEILQGRKMSFDEESIGLYGSVAPTHPYSFYDGRLKELEKMLPGDGTLAERYSKFRAKFEIPEEKLDVVMRRALQECRKRTAAHITLPEGEKFKVEYVKDKPWGAYNWYKGNLQSLIEVNTDLPKQIDQPVGLACHEGYPGHHAYNALLEAALVQGKGWVEFTVYPLFSPQSLIAEGSANYGTELAFPGNDRKEFEVSVLFPLAGLKTDDADTFYKIRDLMEDLSYASNDIARDYFSGKIGSEDAKQRLLNYGLMTPERAAQQLRFIDTYRSYIINYNLGKDLVQQFIESTAGEDQEKR